MDESTSAEGVDWGPVVETDRVFLTTLAWYEGGWESVEEACRKGGYDPMRAALAAIAREVVRTSIAVQETATALEVLHYKLTGKTTAEALALYDEVMAAAGGDEP